MATDAHKLALFADDVLVYLAQPTQTLPKCMDILKEYGTLSGYKLNILKTQIIYSRLIMTHLVVSGKYN